MFFWLLAQDFTICRKQLRPVSHMLRRDKSYQDNVTRKGTGWFRTT